MANSEITLARKLKYKFDNLMSEGPIAIGYRQMKHSHNAGKAYGVFVSPKKSAQIVFDEFNKLIVLAED